MPRLVYQPIPRIHKPAPHHHHVVAGAIQQRCQDLARRARSKAAEDTLVATQTACGIAGLPTPLPAPDPLPGEKGQLAPPTVEGPLRACQRAVTVSNVIDGARVILEETPAPGFTEQACFDLPTLWFPVPPLKA